MRIGIICEGSSDYPVLKSIVATLVGHPATFSLLQPNFDTLAVRAQMPGPGWHGVRAFLGRPNLAVVADVHDLIVIQIDADVRHSKEVEDSLPAAGDEDDELTPLCDLVKSWAEPPLPETAIVTLPRESTDTWLVAAHTRRKKVQEIAKPAKVLLDAGLIDATERGKPDKAAFKYEELSRGLDTLLGDPKKLRRRGRGRGCEFEVEFGSRSTSQNVAS